MYELVDEHHPRVSVLIGCWNNAETLRQAIDSILAQTVDDLELIVVDDGSTDRTPEIVKDVQATDGGSGICPCPTWGSRAASTRACKPRAASTSRSRTPTIGLCQSVSNVSWKCSPRRPEVAVVGCRMREVDAQGRELTPRTTFAAGDVNDVLLGYNPIPNSCAMLRRRLALEAGGFDPRYRYAMDYDLWLRLSETQVIATIDDELAVRRMTGLNVAARKERAQTTETIEIRLAALRRRRSLQGAHRLAVPLVSLVTPQPLKRAVRRRRGQAP